MSSVAQDKAVRKIIKERDRQDTKWGDQRHHSWAEWGVILGEEAGEVMMECTKNHFGGSQRILCLEEELIQTAAVAICMLEAIYEGRYEASDG